MLKIRKFLFVIYWLTTGSLLINYSLGQIQLDSCIIQEIVRITYKPELIDFKLVA